MKKTDCNYILFVCFFFSPSQLYRLDLERGDVVETWQTSSNVRELFPETKTSQQTDSPLLMGMNSKVIYLFICIYLF